MFNNKAKQIIGSITTQELWDFANRPDSQKDKVELYLENFDRRFEVSFIDKNVEQCLDLMIEFFSLWLDVKDDPRYYGHCWTTAVTFKLGKFLKLSNLDKKFISVAALFYMVFSSKKEFKGFSGDIVFFKCKLLDLKEKGIAFSEAEDIKILKSFQDFCIKEKIEDVYEDYVKGL